MLKIGNRGFGLIEVMVAAGIASIIALVVAGMISQMRRSLVSIERKQSLLQFQNSMFVSFQNGDVCGWQLKESAPGVPRTIDLSKPPNAVTKIIPDAEIAFSKLYQGVDSTAPILAQAADVIAGTNSVVNSIQLKNVTAVDKDSGFYSGDIEVEIQFPLSETILKNPKTKIFFYVKTNDPQSAKKILGCSASSPSEVIFTYPKKMIPYPTNVGFSWTYLSATPPSALGVPSSAKQFLVQVRCKQADPVKIDGLAGGEIILCRSGNNESNYGTLWLNRYVESFDFYNGIPLRGYDNGGASSIGMDLIGYR